MITLRDLVYQKSYSEIIHFKLLNIVSAPNWLEQLFDLIKELDTRDFERGCCESCEEANKCETCRGYHNNTQLVEKLLDTVRKNANRFNTDPQTLAFSEEADHVVDDLNVIMQNVSTMIEEIKDKNSKQCTIGGIVCPCDEES